MKPTPEDRRNTPPPAPEGTVRPHDTSTVVKAALELQQAGRIGDALELLARVGLSDEVATRILCRGQVRAEDATGI